MRHAMVLAFSVAVLVAAFGGCSGGGGSGGAPGGNLMVTAHVVTFAGNPVSSVAVWISGQGPFFTDGNGDVVVQGAPSPYTAVIIEGAAGTADYWPGLTRPDPTFIISEGALAAFSADIDGTVVGGIGFPTPPNHETMVLASFAPGALGNTTATADPMTGAYAFQNLEWAGNPVSDFSLIGMQYLADATGAPVMFTGFGGTVLQPISPGVVIHQNVPLFPVATETITGTINAPSGVIAAAFFMTLEFPSGRVIVGPTVNGFTPTLSLNVPAVASLAPGVMTLAESFSLTSIIFAWRRNLPVPPTDIGIDLPTATDQILPVNGSTGIDYQTVFQVTPTPGNRVFIVTFSPQTSGSGPTIRLHTTASSFSIPDLSSFGMGIPAGADYKWKTEAQGSLASLDEAAVPNKFVGIAPFASNSTTDAFYCNHVLWDFQFGP